MVIIKTNLTGCDRFGASGTRTPANVHTWTVVCTRRACLGSDLLVVVVMVEWLKVVVVVVGGGGGVVDFCFIFEGGFGLIG